MASIPVISVVGKSNSGKTSFIEHLIPRLIAEGLKVATIKHDVHGFSMDKPGKDTWRHKESGAGMVIISSPKKVALIMDVEEEYTVDRLQEELIKGFDLILTEGYKKGDKPKIEVFRPQKHEERLCSPDRDRILATVINRERQQGEASFDPEEMNLVVNTIKDFLQRGEG